MYEYFYPSVLLLFREISLFLILQKQSLEFQFSYEEIIVNHQYAMLYGGYMEPGCSFKKSS